MHVDHGSLLELSSNGLIGTVNYARCRLQANRQFIPTATTKQAFSRSACSSANRLGQAAQRRDDREQQVVQLNSKTSCAGKRSNARRLRDKKPDLASQKIKICGHASDRMSISRATENSNSHVKI
jgi:hypothetical protein